MNPSEITLTIASHFKENLGLLRNFQRKIELILPRLEAAIKDTQRIMAAFERASEAPSDSAIEGRGEMLHDTDKSARLYKVADVLEGLAAASRKAGLGDSASAYQEAAGYVRDELDGKSRLED